MTKTFPGIPSPPISGQRTAPRAPAWPQLRAADDAFSEHMYLPARRRLGPLQLAWHPDLKDMEWNRLRVQKPSAKDLRRWLERGLQQLGSGCVEIGPEEAPHLEARLRRWRFAPVFEHRWIVLPIPSAMEHRDGPGDLVIHPANPRRRDDFIAVFHQGFACHDQGHLGSGWDRALRRLLTAQAVDAPASRPLPRLFHCVAYSSGEAVGVASLGILGELAGLYNLAVPPRFRRQGIANALMHHRLRMAGQLGARTAFLQTDDDTVYRWHRRRGYLPGPVVRGWSPLADPVDSPCGEP